MASLPQVGVQAVVLGMAAFTSNARSVEAQLAMMGAASYRLERASNQSFGGVIGAIQRMNVAVSDASKIYSQAVQAQATASAVAAIKINEAQRNVGLAAETAAAKVAQAQAVRAQADAKQSAAFMSARAAEDAARSRSVRTLELAQQAQLRADRSAILSTEANAAAVLKAEIAKQSAIKATEAARVAAALTEVSKLDPTTSPRAVEAASATEAAVAAKAHAVAMEQEAVSAAAAAKSLDALAIAELKAAAATAGEAVAAEQALVAARATSTATIEVTSAARVAAAATEAAAVTAASAEEAAAVSVAGIEITAAEAEMAAATEVAAAEQIAADEAVKASKIGLALAIAGAAAIAVAALVAIGAAAVIMGQKYERALAFTAAVSGATAAQVRQLDAAHMHLSRTTTTSAGALNEISAELLKAGQTVESVLGGTLKATNDLVVASNGELKAADAAVLMQVAMAGFHVSAQRAADATTVAVQKSTLTFGEFADAIRQGGANAANAGLSFDEFSAVIGTMGLTINSGAEAATSLRVMLQRMQKPTEEATDLLNAHKISLYNAAGAARPFADVIKDLQREYSDQTVSLGKLTQQERNHDLAVIFGQRASKGAIALIRQGTDEYNKMLEAVKQNNAAQILANQLLLPTGAQLEIIRNNVQDLGIAFNKGLDPYINKVVSSLLAWLQTIDIDKIIAFGDAVGSKAYNAFANFGNLLSTKVTPNMNVFQTAVYATAAVVTAQFALMAARAVWSAGIIAAAYLQQVIPVFLRYIVTVIAAAYTTASAMAVNMVSSVTTFATAAGLSMGAVILVLGAVGAAAGLLAVAWANNWFDIQGTVKSAIEWMEPALSKFFNWLGSAMDSAGERWKAQTDKWAEALNLPSWAKDLFLRQDAFTDNTSRLAAAQPPGVEGIKKFAVAAGDAGAAIRQFGDDAIKAFDAVKNFKIPDQHDFAADVKKAWDDAADARDAALGKKGPGGAPAGETEAGEYPEKPDDAAAKKLASALARGDELVRDFNDDIDKAVRATAADISKLYESAWNDVNIALAQHEADVNKAMEEAGGKISEIYAAKNIKDDIDARTKALDEGLKNEEKFRAQNLADIELAHQRQLQDEERVQQALRKIREDAFARQQEDAAIARDEIRQGEDRTFQEDLDAQVRNLQERQDAVERSLKKEQDAREATLKATQDAEERALQASQDRRERALQKILDAEKLARDQTHDKVKLEEEIARDKADAQGEYTKQIGEGVKQSIAQTRLNEALHKIDVKAADDRAKLASSQTYETATDAFNDAQKSRMQTLKDEFAVEDLAQQVKHNDEKLKLDARHEKELFDLHASQERDRRKLDDDLDKELRDRKKTRDAEDRAFAEQQERDKNVNNAKEDARALSEARLREDAERERKRKQDELDQAFKDEQDKKKQDLQKKFEEEDLQRRLDNIEEEKQEALKAADITLAEVTKKQQDKLAQDLKDLSKNMDDRIATIRENYIDKLDDIAREGGEKILPRVKEITNTISTGLYAVRDAAQAAVDKLAEAFGASQKLANLNTIAVGAAAGELTGGSTGQDYAARNAYKNNAKAHYMHEGYDDSDADDLAEKEAKDRFGFQYGGIVPGPYGSQVPIMAHGGERYEGVGAYGIAMTAVRTAEAMLSRGVGGRPAETNNYSWNVNAHYGRVQPEGSVARDLSALVTLTK